MAAVSPINDVLSAPSSNSLVLPPSSNRLALASTATVDGQPATAAQPTSLSTATATGASPLSSVTNQPLAAVLDALTTAGVDGAINQEILASSLGQATGTFSTFVGELFSALAAQTSATELSAQQAATQQVTPTVAQTPASLAATAFAATALSLAPHSALESEVQNLAQAVSAQSVDPAQVTDATASSSASLAPLQQSFEQLVANANGTANSASLGGFLEALAGNLHAAPSPLGNIVDSSV
jgi:hypothetical protein